MKFKPSQLPNIPSEFQTFDHISLSNLLWLSIKPALNYLTKPLRKIYYRHQANHYALCIAHETTLSQQHAQNATYYAKAQALATAKLNNLN